MRPVSLNIVLPTAALLASFGAPAIAKPLAPEACARLSQQRAALEASGTRAAFSQPPPVERPQVLDEAAKNMRALMDLDGQLRFRCHMYLPITSLRPDLLVEVPDHVEGEAVASDVGASAVRRAKPITHPKAVRGAVATATGKHQPAVSRTTTASVPSAVPFAGDPPVRPSHRPRVKAAARKVDDALRPAVGPEPTTPNAKSP